MIQSDDYKWFCVNAVQIGDRIVFKMVLTTLLLLHYRDELFSAAQQRSSITSKCCGPAIFETFTIKFGQVRYTDLALRTHSYVHTFTYGYTDQPFQKFPLFLFFSFFTMLSLHCDTPSAADLIGRRCRDTSENSTETLKSDFIC